MLVLPAGQVSRQALTRADLRSPNRSAVDSFRQFIRQHRPKLNGIQLNHVGLARERDRGVRVRLPVR